MSVSESYNFKAIHSTLTTSGVINAEQLQQLKPEGYGGVINLLPQDSEYATVQEAELVTRQQLNYTYIPVDFAAPANEDYQQFEQAMQSWEKRSDNTGLHVHCAANYRVSAFIAIYGYRHWDWTTEQVKTHVTSIWNPQEHPQWVSFLQQFVADYQ